MTDEQDKEAERELEIALAAEAGLSPAQAEAQRNQEINGDERFKTATMGDVVEAMELLTYFLKQSEKATKLAAKLGGGGLSPQNAMVAKMLGGIGK